MKKSEQRNMSKPASGEMKQYGRMFWIATALGGVLLLFAGWVVSGLGTPAADLDGYCVGKKGRALIVVDLKTGAITTKRLQIDVNKVAFSRDGATIAYSDAEKLVIEGPKFGRQEFHLPKLIDSIAVSPDGARALVSERRNLEEVSSQLYILSAPGTRISVAVPRAGFPSSPEWLDEHRYAYLDYSGMVIIDDTRKGTDRKLDLGAFDIASSTDGAALALDIGQEALPVVRVADEELFATVPLEKGGRPVRPLAVLMDEKKVLYLEMHLRWLTEVYDLRAYNWVTGETDTIVKGLTYGEAYWCSSFPSWFEQ